LSIGALTYRKVQNIFTGGNHCFLINQRYSRKENRTFTSVFGWGLNNWGQLGIGKSDNTYKAVELEALRDANIRDIVGGEYHTLILFENGVVKGCGINNDYQLGPLDIEEFKNLHPNLSEKEAALENPEAVYLPTTIKIGSPCKQVLASSNFSYAIQEDNSTRSWGLGYSYVLGNGKEEEIQTPHTINPKLLKTEVG
jgi:regulator of chromosome condensation